MNTLTSSRRDVMRALATLSVASVPTMAIAARPSSILPDPKWHAAVQAEREAFREQEAYWALHMQSGVINHGIGEAAFEAIQDEEAAYANLRSAHDEALNALLLTPAPTYDAIAHKLRSAHQFWVFDGSDQASDLLAGIITDIERLAGAN